jgi:glycosyltransferase involved in cell wall biosynthesis
LRASVVVPTHGGAHRLPDLLDAMAVQDFDGEWELIVVIDGIVDDTVSLLEGYRDRLPLRTIVHDTGRGVVAVLNDAFAQARGEVLIRCDDDLTPRPDFVRRHVAHHLSSTGIGVIGPTRDVFPDTPYARAYGRLATERSLQAAYRRPEDQRWIGWAANNSVHREAWACAGGFSPRFVYGQDSELGWRLAHHCGVRIVVDPDLQVDHRGPSTSAATRIPRAFVSGASKRLFYIEHPSERPEPARPSNLKGRAWAALVAALAGMVRSKSGYERIGQWVDAVLAIAPERVGGIATALCVEAAGRSGLRNGADDLTIYRTQKSAELSREIQHTTRSESTS